ncbi:hypothetical protein [Mycobacterium paraintracellulare]|uniref:Uncharacterized protein n=1 Tax=Mycobacterium paraintracellulare TaxID=1138383 RepID=A0ABM7K7X5_9MYCO|nr:hypothetical protein [Mycobacterium paraintracellulare]BBY70107.1 hypothetical protein MPRI_22940 [Mycobacterium paraintracellulare]
MKINDPKASYSQVSGVFLTADRADDHGLLVSIKPGSLKVKDGTATFTAIVLESDVASLYVPPSERLANR